MCIAGVLGGLNSGITESTVNVFFRICYFDPITVRKTSKRQNISTDASFRFERGIDPNLTEYTLKYAAMLIAEIVKAKYQATPLMNTKLKQMTIKFS